jgi:hypothetical protein
MISQSRLDRLRRVVGPWVPAAFCAFLSLITICTNLCLAIVNHSPVGEWPVLFVFLCFLPMCFFFSGGGTSQALREIAELKKQIEQLQKLGEHQS